MMREREVAHFWSKVDRTTDADDYCWEFRGAGKYRTFYSSAAGRKVGAHRFAWELVNGPIPDGWQVDHTCRVPSCVRPSHLEAVTQVENLRRRKRRLASIIADVRREAESDRRLAIKLGARTPREIDAMASEFRRERFRDEWRMSS